MPNQEKDLDKHADKHSEKNPDKHDDKDVERDREKLRDKERDKVTASNAVTDTLPGHPAPPLPGPAGKSAAEGEDEASHYFFGEPLVGFDPAEITGTLVVIEGMDGSGRSTQITLLQEWLESEGFAVQTSGPAPLQPGGQRHRSTPRQKRRHPLDAGTHVRHRFL